MQQKKEIAILLSILVIFIGMAAIQLSVYPAPWVDESWLMQPSVEVVKGNHISMPMFRLLGSEVGEKIFTDPIFSYSLAAFLKLFGSGITQARAFNLIISVGILLMVWLITRKLFDYHTALLAITILAFNSNYFESARYLRNDFLAIFFVMAALMFWLRSEQNSIKDYLLALSAGLMAGLGFLSHMNAFCAVVLIAVLAIKDLGWRAFVSKRVWLAAMGTLLAIAPWAIYCVQNWTLYTAQWDAFNPEHRREQALSLAGLLRNAMAEPQRYAKSFKAATFMQYQHMQLFFLLLALIAILYLFVFLVKNRSEAKNLLSAKINTLSITLTLVLFFATVISNKTHSYLPYLACAFSIAISVLFVAGYRYIKTDSIKTPLSLAITIIAFSYFAGTVYNHVGYLMKLQASNIVKLNEFKTVVKTTVGEKSVPLGKPTFWYIFIERDDYLAFSNRSMKRTLEQIFDNKFPQQQFTLIVEEREDKRLKNILTNLDNPPITLIKELTDTPYGKVRIYTIGRSIN